MYLFSNRTFANPPALHVATPSQDAYLQSTDFSPSVDTDLLQTLQLLKADCMSKAIHGVIGRSTNVIPQSTLQYFTPSMS